MSFMPSPAAASGTVSGTVTIPQAIEQMALSYVNITTLFLNAHELWEQAEELAHKGSGKNGWKNDLCGDLSQTDQTSKLNSQFWLRTKTFWGPTLSLRSENKVECGPVRI